MGLHNVVEERRERGGERGVGERSVSVCEVWLGRGDAESAG